MRGRGARLCALTGSFVDAFQSILPRHRLGHRALAFSVPIRRNRLRHLARANGAATARREIAFALAQKVRHHLITIAQAEQARLARADHNHPLVSASRHFRGINGGVSQWAVALAPAPRAPLHLAPVGQHHAIGLSACAQARRAGGHLHDVMKRIGAIPHTQQQTKAVVRIELAQRRLRGPSSACDDETGYSGARSCPTRRRDASGPGCAARRGMRQKQSGIAPLTVGVSAG